MRADGSNARRVTRGGGPDLYPAWSPDGKQIAFSSGRAGAEPEIYVVRPNGGALRRLTSTANWVQDVQPQFSPDGRHIVFTSNRVAYWNFEIFRVRASDGRGLKRLTFWGSGADGAAGDDHMPSYSPNGKSIVFVSDRFGGDAIWTMDSDGTNARGVLHHRGVAPTFPRFSPDGSHIVWSSLSDNPATDEQIHTVRADGNFADTLARGREADW
jgi:TolB protein